MRIETYRKTVRPDLRCIIVAVDPSGTKGADQGDTVGIVLVGRGLDGDVYVLEDASVKVPPAVWGRVLIATRPWMGRGRRAPQGGLSPLRLQSWLIREGLP